VRLSKNLAYIAGPWPSWAHVDERGDLVIGKSGDGLRAAGERVEQLFSYSPIYLYDGFM